MSREEFAALGVDSHPPAGRQQPLWRRQRFSLGSQAGL